jgi:hypothetical protein
MPEYGADTKGNQAIKHLLLKYTKDMTTIYTMTGDSTERTMIPILISKADCAMILGVSVRAIDYLITNKKLESRRLGRRVLVVRSSVLRFAAKDNPEPLCQ